jgi:hypothetical protein
MLQASCVTGAFRNNGNRVPAASISVLTTEDSRLPSIRRVELSIHMYNQ